MARKTFDKANLRQTRQFSKASILKGLRLPDGRVFISVDPNTSLKTLSRYADALGGEIVTIRGVWKFIPDD